MFLMGMGIVNFCRSRSNILGWNAKQLMSHFAIRGAILAIANDVVVLPLASVALGFSLWIVSPVMLALAANYFVVGLLRLAINAPQNSFSHWLYSFMASNSEETESELGKAPP